MGWRSEVSAKMYAYRHCRQTSHLGPHRRNLDFDFNLSYYFLRHSHDPAVDAREKRHETRHRLGRIPFLQRTVQILACRVATPQPRRRIYLSFSNRSILSAVPAPHLMQTPLLLVTSILTIIISILSVQIPRYIQHHHHHRFHAPRHSSHQNSSSHRPMTDGTTDGKTSPLNDTTPPPVLKLRKPWDPPFPTTSKGKGKEKESGWRILPPMPSDAPSTQRQGDRRSGDRVHDVPTNESVSQESSVNVSKASKPKDQSQQDSEAGMSILWTSVAVLAGVFLILLCAILIAHCLAWFIVYKTEARLGEARRGLVTGGEMRLCLCARG